MSSRNLDIPPEIGSLLRRRIGLSPLVLGARGLRDAVVQRLTACGCSDARAYLDLLEQDFHEVQNLIETVVVPESWFFRDLRPFECLRHYVKHRRTTNSFEPLRVLSLPCGNGEEPYSMAMTLLDLGIDPARVKIDACDISKEAIARASRGTFSQMSLRDKSPSSQRLLQRYGEQSNGRYKVYDNVRSMVRFREENLLSATLLRQEKPYHVIFTRNLFIYLAEEARQQALANLTRLLAPEGILYVGHVEAGIPESAGFQRYHADFPFAFVSPTNPLESGDLSPVWIKPNIPIHVESSLSTKPTIQSCDKSQHSKETLLQRAQRLANAGQLLAAAELCLEHLQTSPSDAQAHYLLALVRAGQGRSDEAERLLRKTVYLNPHHAEALMWLATLLRQRGETSQAELLRARAERQAVEGS